MPRGPGCTRRCRGGRVLRARVPAGSPSRRPSSGCPPSPRGVAVDLRNLPAGGPWRRPARPCKPMQTSLPAESTATSTGISLDEAGGIEAPEKGEGRRIDPSSSCRSALSCASLFKSLAMPRNLPDHSAAFSVKPHRIARPGALSRRRGPAATDAASPPERAGRRSPS